MLSEAGSALRTSGTLRYSTSLRTDHLDALDEEFRPFRERFGVGIETRA
jgi:hypothetical protein